MLDHIDRLARLEKWPVVAEQIRYHFGTARDTHALLLCYFNCELARAVSIIAKGGVSGRGLYRATYSTSKSDRARDPRAMPNIRNSDLIETHSCFFTWKSRHRLIPVTSDFFHCIPPRARLVPPSPPSPPSRFVREGPSRRPDAADFTEAPRIRDCMTFSLWSEGACHKTWLKLVRCLRRVGASQKWDTPKAQVFPRSPLLSLSLPLPLRVIRYRLYTAVMRC